MWWTVLFQTYIDLAVMISVSSSTHSVNPRDISLISFLFRMILLARSKSRSVQNECDPMKFSHFEANERFQAYYKNNIVIFMSSLQNSKQEYSVVIKLIFDLSIDIRLNQFFNRFWFDVVMNRVCNCFFLTYMNFALMRISHSVGIDHQS